MAPDEPSGQRPAGPVVLRIKLRYDNVDTMVQRFAPNVGKSGLFLPTRSVQPVGAEIKFELRLVNGEAVLVGLGRVKAVKEPDPANPKATFGMAVELMRVTRESRDLILRMLERRRELGLVESRIPMPEDIDAARRADSVDGGVKDLASGPVVTTPIPAVDSQAEGLLTSPRRQTGPIAVARSVEAAPPLAPEPIRRRRPGLQELIETASGPVGSVTTLPGLDDDVDVAAALARARALAGGDLDAELDAILESAAAPLEVGIEAASAELAKQLGGAAVRRGWAPPPAVRSEEHARAKSRDAGADETGAPRDDEARAQAGDEAKASSRHDEVGATRADDASAKPDHDEASDGGAVAKPRDVKVRKKLRIERARSGDADADALTAKSVEANKGGAVVAPEPSDTLADPDAAAAALDAERARKAREDEYVARERARDEAFLQRLAEEDAARERAVEEHDAQPPASANEITTEPRPTVEREQLEDDGVGPEHEVEPDQIHDEIHQLSEDDFEEVEQTAIGASPNAFDDHAFATRPSAENEILSDRLDAHLAAVEAEHEHDDLGIGEARGTYDRSLFERPAPIIRSALPIEYQDDYIHRFDVPEGATVDDRAADYTPDAPPTDRAYAAAYRAHDPDSYGRTVDVGLATTDGDVDDVDNEIEEIDDFEILAEADADDADLLNAHGEADLSGSSVIHDAPMRPSHSDFASRLDLGDESDVFHRVPDPGYLEHGSDGAPHQIDSRIAASAGHALAGFDDDDRNDFDESSNRSAFPAPGQPIFDDQGSSSYTLAGEPSPGESLEFDAPHAGFASAPNQFDPPHSGFLPPNQFDQSDVIDIGADAVRSSRTPVLEPSAPTPIYNEPYLLRGPPPGMTPAKDVDLESALEALDVDLDDLSMPHASTELARDGGSQPIRGRPTIRPAPTTQSPAPVRQTGGQPRAKRQSDTRAPTPAPTSTRAVTDDGVLIDFDDDDEK